MLVAGVDVGNTTTEVVVVELPGSPGRPAYDSGGVRPLGWDWAPTRSTKGSTASLHGAAVLVRRIEQRLGRRVDLVAAAPLRPVHTRAASLTEAAPATGRLVVVPVGGATPGGLGTAVGVPVRIDAAVLVGQPVVLLVPAGTGYAATVTATGAWLAAGADVRGLLLADDEGVLVAARLPVALAGEVPVADEVELDRLADAVLVAVEIRPPGHPVQDVSDPIRLSALLGLAVGERSDAGVVAAALASVSRAVVALRPLAAVIPRPASDGAPAHVGSFELRTSRDVVPLAAGVGARVAGLAVGATSAWTAGTDRQVVDDLWLAELGEVARSVAARVDPAVARALVVAALTAGAELVDPAASLAAELGRPVHVVGSEAAAARAGAASTPGVRPSVTVVDLGGGTVDVIGPAGDEVVAAGAGELLTVAVSVFLGLPRGAADWVKRGPSSRLEAPQVLLAEDGTRTFLDAPAPSAALGSLVVGGPAGLLPFGGSLAPAEWRALRLRTKQRVLADNVVRAVRSLPGGAVPDDLLIVGGAAADAELVGLLHPGLPGVSVGRGDVAGVLGHRYAVAYGLALLALR